MRWTLFATWNRGDETALREIEHTHAAGAHVGRVGRGGVA